MRISEIHPVERPRERLALRGPQALGEDELLAILLRTGYAGRSALDIARELKRSHPNGALGRLRFSELCRIKGVGPSRAAALIAGLELARRWQSRDNADEPALDNPEQVWRELRGLRGRRKEHFVALYLNACNRMIYHETVSVGTLTASLVHPREVFAPAVERGAASVIVAHNHPSGNSRPSAEDREVTQRLIQAGLILGIPLIDHVLVTDKEYFSLREHGLMGDG